MHQIPPLGRFTAYVRRIGFLFISAMLTLVTVNSTPSPPNRVISSASGLPVSQEYGIPSVLTQNLMLLPSGITDWSPDERAKMIGTEEYLKHHDILVLTELFDNSATDDHLFPQMSKDYPYGTPVIGRGATGWNETSGGYYGFPLEDGGVGILSKWPIAYKSQYIFGGGCGSDYWAAKGFAYVILRTPGRSTHLIGTHLQANDAGCDSGESERIRAAQLKAISRFLSSRHIPAHEPILMAGDFNVEYGSGEYSDLLEALGVASPRIVGEAKSFDPSINSLARYRESFTKPRQLDYIFVRQGSGFDVSNVTLRVHSPRYIMRGTSFVDLSDHYPVVASPQSWAPATASPAAAPDPAPAPTAGPPPHIPAPRTGTSPARNTPPPPGPTAAASVVPPARTPPPT